MFAAAADYTFSYLLSGIIMSVAFGLAVGNYACSLVHRLPRGKPLLDKTPYCGSCGKLLEVRDLFPVFSALALKHRCRYCGTPFPASHTWTEAATALLFTLAFLQYNFGETYLLIVTVGTFLITLAAIEANDGIVMGKVLACAALSGIVYRVLLDGSIYGFLLGGVWGLLAGLALQFRQIKKIGHVYVPPPLAALLAAGGLCVGISQLPAFLALFFGLWLLGRLLGKMPITVPFGLAVAAVLLFIPQ